MALGKGLGLILEEVGLAYENEINSLSIDDANSIMNIQEIDINTISPNPYQPRKHFDLNSLKELSLSIKNHGLLQPIVVIEKKNGYILVAGERRLRAHKLANINNIKAIVASMDLDSFKLRELALLENIQRENLNSMELAKSYAELIEVYQITHEQLSHIVHKSRSHITNTMRLLALSQYVQQYIMDTTISQGHAKILIGLDENQQKEIIDKIIDEKISVRDTEQLAKRYKEKKVIKNKIKDTFLDEYSKLIKEKLIFNHKIKDNKLEINFKSVGEIESFLRLIEK